MDRRSFFTRGVGKVAKAVTNHAAEKARENALRWIRPPFAIEELDLLLACNRCGDCISACKYGVIFPLSAKLGVKVFNTPAMDLANHGCHMCEDWPCVEVCEKGVLKFPEIDAGEKNASEKNEIQDKESTADELEDKIPKQLSVSIATVFINEKTCLPYSGPECGACRICPIEGAMIWEMERPKINQQLCTGCALCREACITEPKAIMVQSKYKSR